MEFEVIEDNALAEQLLAELSHTGAYPAVEQHGPLRWFEKEMRCASKGCGSPTGCKLQGIPRCGIHALRKMNEMLIERGVEQ